MPDGDLTYCFVTDTLTAALKAGYPHTGRTYHIADTSHSSELMNKKMTLKDAVGSSDVRKLKSKSMTGSGKLTDSITAGSDSTSLPNWVTWVGGTDLKFSTVANWDKTPMAGCNLRILIDPGGDLTWDDIGVTIGSLKVSMPVGLAANTKITATTHQRLMHGINASDASASKTLTIDFATNTKNLVTGGSVIIGNKTTLVPTIFRCQGNFDYSAGNFTKGTSQVIMQQGNTTVTASADHMYDLICTAANVLAGSNLTVDNVLVRITPIANGHSISATVYHQCIPQMLQMFLKKVGKMSPDDWVRG